MDRWYLGIDTSNYTTSLAVVDHHGRLQAEARRLLRVKEGERGLRQGEAFFQHVQHLPEVMEEMVKSLPGEGEALGSNLAGVAVSARPRPVEGSYMPVFTAGHSLGRSLALAFGVPLMETSHQEGHLMAGLWSGGGPEAREFLALHLSGGTTEILRVNRREGGFGEEILGGTRDLHGGQLVDRVGVRLGLPFPAGPALERLARDGEAGRVMISSRVSGCHIHLSGAETIAMGAIAAGARPADVALGVLACLAKGVEKLIRNAMEQTGLADVLLVGGVAANGYLRERLRRRLEHKGVGARLYFAEARYSSDNAVGVALLMAKQK